MNVVFPIEENKFNGPENWRRTLVTELSKHNKVELIKGNNFFRNIVKVYNADIIHSYNPSIKTVFSIFMSKVFGKKIIHTVHGDFYTENKSKTGLKRIFWIPFNRICISFANAVTFPSRYLENIILKSEPIVKKKSFIIPNGMDFKYFNKIRGYSKKELGLKKSDFLILEITNFNYEKKAKGIELLVKEFNKIKKSNRDYYLFIIGDGKLFEFYKSKYESSSIKFLGYKVDAIKYIKSCDLFVHFTFLDNLPLVLLEAIACNKPVLSISTGGIPEIIPIDLLIDKGRFNSLEKVIRHLLSPYKYSYLNEYKLIKEKLSIRNVAKHYIEVYKNG